MDALTIISLCWTLGYCILILWVKKTFIDGVKRGALARDFGESYAMVFSLAAGYIIYPIVLIILIYIYINHKLKGNTHV